jgi:MFS transporter, DHA2 family, multidrug resistance protein
MDAGCLGLFILWIGSAAHHERPGLISIEIASAVLLGWALYPHTGGFSGARAAYRPVSHTDLRPFHCHRDLLVYGPGPGPCLRRSSSRILFAVCRSRRAFSRPLGSCSGHHGADRRPSIRSPFRRNSRWPRLALLSLGMALLAMLPAHVVISLGAWPSADVDLVFLKAPNMKALMSSALADRSGRAGGMVATACLTGQTIGAALAALCFGLAGREGATLALALGAVLAATGSGMSFLRLVATTRSAA